jgi:cytochrome P450
MFDALRIATPDEFRLDRSPRDYLFFGYGLHTCFGQHVNQVQIPRILEPLLARPNLRRAQGDAGKLTREGPFAGSLQVLFD